MTKKRLILDAAFVIARCSRFGDSGKCHFDSGRVVARLALFVVFATVTFPIACMAAEPWRAFEANKVYSMRQVVFLDGGKTLAFTTSDPNNGFRLVDVESGKEIVGVDPNNGGPRGFFSGSADGNLLSIAGQPPGPVNPDKDAGWTIRFYDTKEKKFVSSVSLTRHYCAGGFLTPDGMHFVIGDRRGGVVFYDVKAGKEAFKLDGPEKVTYLTVSPNGKLLAVGDKEGAIWIWDIETRKRKSILQGFEAVVTMTFAPDSKTLACANENRTVNLWDVAKEQHGNVVKVNTVEKDALVFSPDGKTLAISGLNGDVYLWDLSAEKFDKSTTIPGVKLNQTTAIAFSPDGKLIAVGSGLKGIEVYKLPLGSD